MSTQTVYYLTADNGDGSSRVKFYQADRVSRLELAYMMEDNPEKYSSNEDTLGILHFPEEVDLEDCGFYFSSVPISTGVE